MHVQNDKFEHNIGMEHRRMRIHRLVALLLAAHVGLLAQQVVPHYKLSMPEPWTHLFHVEVSFEGLPATDGSLELILPVWRTGRYVLFDFAGSVQEFSAENGQGTPLSWQKTDKATWNIATKGNPVLRVKYKVYAAEFESRTKGLNDEYAFVDGVTVFMYAEKYRKRPLTVDVKPYGSWHVTTGLDATAGDSCRFAAPDYDHLADCPMFIGRQKDYLFTAGGKPHILSVLGQGRYTADTLIADLKAIVEACKQFWGELPYERYVFMLQLWSGGGGGTEHINSTIMQMGPFLGSRERENFQELAAHEYFHTWNVKQIRPRGISPYDYTRENYAREYWIAEGTTSYYTQVILQKASLLSSEGILRMLAQAVRHERERPGNRIQSLSESSFDAWIKFWRERPNAYNSEADYYDKGSAVSLLLDLTIRNDSKGQSSLDDVMRALYKRFPRDGTGYTVEDFQNICEEYSGSSLQDFFDAYVHGTVPLPWEKVLGYAGLEVKSQGPQQTPWLGVIARERDGKSLIVGVVAGSPAYDGGLNVSDELLALNGYRVGARDLPSRVSEMSVGDTVRMTVFRDDILREFTIPLGTQPVSNYTVVPLPKPTGLQRKICEAWIGQVLKAGK
jgi:predicted metalloprotease with PDZ domain